MVNVKKKKNIQTSLCRPSIGLSDLQLNKPVSMASVASSKTLLNSSKESRKQKKVPTSTVSHNGTIKPEHRACFRKQDVVFVINRNGEPLMPTKSGEARRMLESGLAKCVSRTPFVIQMLVQTCEFKNKIDAGVDTGSKKIGVALPD